MQSHQITEEEKKELLEYLSMIESDDFESVQLGKSLLDVVFGKYRLYESNSPTLSFIINYNTRIYRNLHLIMHIRLWISIAINSKCLFYNK